MVLLNLCTRVLTTYYHIRINEKYTTAMLSTNMTENNESRIEFPDKDPTDQWKVFYPFIDPSKIGMATPSAIIKMKML